MALRLEDRWVWDMWLADDGERHHAFYLQADRALGDHHLRHWNVSIGHAVSTDLVDWEVQPDALQPGPAGSWDDAATWTGCVVRRNGTWWMFYTGASTRDDALVQRIGAATSTDLVTWERHPANPLVEADPRWYEKLDLDAWHDEAWRDPWVVRDEGGWHMLITARRREGDAEDRGVIGYARSADLAAWEVGPPVSAPGGFGQLEVPQSATVDGAPLLLFSADPAHVSDTRRATASTTLEAGTYVARGTSEIGPFDVAGARLLPYPGLYSCRLVQRRTGAWALLGFVNEVNGEFAGEISDPLPFDAAAAMAGGAG